MIRKSYDHSLGYRAGASLIVLGAWAWALHSVWRLLSQGGSVSFVLPLVTLAFMIVFSNVIMANAFAHSLKRVTSPRVARRHMPLSGGTSGIG